MEPKTTIAVTGWGILSSIGLDRDSFLESRAAGKSGLKDARLEERFGRPLEQACTIPEFDAVRFLGTKGTRTMDRTTAMSVYTLGAALKQSGMLPTLDPARVGVVIGTSSGSVKSSSDFIAETLIHDKPYLVNPALFPNTVMNCAAGNCAIWHKLRGLNSTISGGPLSGILAFRYASLYLRLGYADALLAGAVEEFCEQSAWAYAKTMARRGRGVPAFGEGCAVFALETQPSAEARGARVLARILGVEAGFCPEARKPSALSASLARCVETVLARSGTAPESVAAICFQGIRGSAIRKLEEEALARSLGVTAGLRKDSIAELAGDAFSAANAFQLADALGGIMAAKASESAPSGPTLVTSLSPTGQVGCLLVDG